MLCVVVVLQWSCVLCSLDKLEYHAGDVMKLQLRLDSSPGIKPRISHLSLQVGPAAGLYYLSEV